MLKEKSVVKEEDYILKRLFAETDKLLNTSEVIALQNNAIDSDVVFTKQNLKTEKKTKREVNYSRD